MLQIVTLPMFHLIHVTFLPPGQEIKEPEELRKTRRADLFWNRIKLYRGRQSRWIKLYAHALTMKQYFKC